MDIETVPEVQNFSDLNPENKRSGPKSQYQRKDEFSAEDYYPVRESGLNLVKLSVFLWGILRLEKMLEHLESNLFRRRIRHFKAI